MTLYPFQQTAVEFHLTHHYSLNCSEMGLGKSRMALETARRVGGKIAIFGPAFLRATWENEAGLVGGIDFKYIPYSMLHKVRPRDLAGVMFWIADEVHFLKNPKAIRTHEFHTLLESCAPRYFIGLTGTPVKNRVPDFWTLLAFCGMNPLKTSGKDLTGDLRKYFKFSRYFCHVEQMRIRGRVIERFGGIRDDRILEFKSLLVDKFIRFKVEDVLKDLPVMTRKEVRLNVVPTDGLEDVFNAYIAGHKTDITAKANSALVKAPATAEYCKNMIDEGSGPLVIFTDHVQPAYLIAEKIKGAIHITGQTAMATRADVVALFQRGKVPALVATIGSLSVGVTLTAARHVVFNDLSWVPSDNLQAEKRVHRIGQKDACFAHYIDGTETDKHIRKTLFAKLETIEKVVG